MTEPMTPPTDTSMQAISPATSDSITPLAPTVMKPIQNGDAQARLISGENKEEYLALHASVHDELKPQSMIERILVSDFITCEWELRRLRAISASAYSAGKPFAVSKLLGYSDDRFSDSPLPTGQYHNALQMLEAKGFPAKSVNAQVAMMFASTFESLDKRAAVLEVRRDQALAKLEARRAEQIEAMKTIEAVTSSLRS
jgi:hypothetical protein